MIEFLQRIKIKRTRGKNSYTYANCIIGIDTETSKMRKNIKGKDHKYIPEKNYIVAYSISILNVDTEEIKTIWGRTPVELISDIEKIRSTLQCDKIFMYVHNLAYDWQFIRRFVYSMSEPVRQLNVKSHRPIMIQLENGIVLKDSLIIAQRSLEKWANDLDVEHKKAVGYWEYDKIRTQNEHYTNDEITYFTFDTISLVECLYKTMKIFNKSVYSIPITATSIPRQQCFKIGSANRARDNFLRMALTAEQQQIMEKVYHGGYTHANRYIIGEVIEGLVKCYDFSSSYPYVLISEKYPVEKFTDEVNQSIEEILDRKENNAFIFKLVASNIHIKKGIVMPTLQLSKLESSCNIEVDNGRILCADYVELYMNEIDLEVFYNTYEYEGALCVEVQQAYKDYLPRWFTDYVYQCFVDKTQYKDGDAVLYGISKGILNSLYGMCVQHPVQDLWIEDIKGDYEKNIPDYNTEYEKYLNREKTILPYQWGVWVTSYAFRNLMKLGSMCKVWLYSDTDSVYGIGWDEKKVDEYNNNCIEQLTKRGYPGVLCHNNGKTYNLGVASNDGEYKAFVTQGAKRYCCKKMDNSLKITVAGVPKKGVKCLKRIEDFKKGKIFRGEVTGKLQHTYLQHEIAEENGIIYADSVDLTPADYLLGSVDVNDLYIEEEVYITYYGEL